MRKIMYLGLLVIGSCVLVMGCGKSKSEGIVYDGVVKEVSESGSNRLLLESLTPVDKNADAVAFEEVILLTEGADIKSEETNKSVKVEDVKAGSKIKVTLTDKAVTTSSIPPQIPGESIMEILVP